MRFEGYEHYKDSEIEWLGDIPSEWSLTRVKDNIKVIDQGWSPSAENRRVEDNEWGVLKLSAIKQGLYNELEHKALSKETISNESYKVEINDVLITRSNTPTFVADVCLVQSTKLNLMYSDLIYRLKLLSKMNAKYFVYMSIANIFRTQITHSYRGLNLSMVKVSGQNIRQWILLFPPLKTQQKIATYLDTRTQKIDNEINLLEEKIEKYKELKQTLINETVLRGLDKKVVLKNSGIEDIPEGWNIKRFKDVVTITTGNSIANKENFEIKENAYPYIATKDIHKDTNIINYDNSIYVPISNKKFKVAKEFTTLMCIEGGSAGKKISFTNQKVCYVNKLCGVKSKPRKILDKYVYYFMRSTLFKNQFFSVINGLIGGVSIGIIKNFGIIVPSFNEQGLIITFLDNKTNQIDQIIKTIEAKIELQKEFRKTLINDVVTGKVKV